MMREENLYEKLIEYSQSDAYPFHMPGHKRRMMVMENPYRFDLTEIDGFDNLHEAEEILCREQEKAAALYHAEETHYMINGSSGGILAAIAAAVNPGDHILVARNCHTSVYHAIELNRLNPIFIWPVQEESIGIYKGITKDQVAQALEAHPEIKAVVFTSPTYEGILSDVEGICECAHRKGIPCIVDEAHGAHLRWNGYKDSVMSGADLVIQSLHKTMPALTQTALIHVNGSLISRKRLRKMLSYYQTSSPSYVLMASISLCMSWLRADGPADFEVYRHNVSRLRNDLKELQCIRIYEPEAEVQMNRYDFGKLVISTAHASLNGYELYHMLRKKYGLQAEMVSAEYVLAMLTVGDGEDGLRRLAYALKEIDANCAFADMKQRGYAGQHRPVTKLALYEAVARDSEPVLLDMACGRIAADYVYLYPPGIPLLIPGEEIQLYHIEKIHYYIEQGLRIYGGYITETGKIMGIVQKDRG